MDIKEELRKNLKYIIILVCLLLLYIVFAVFLTDKDEKADGYLIVGDALIYQKNGDSWEQLDEVPDLDNLVFDVYDGDEKLSNITIQYNAGRFYFFDEDYNEMDFADFRVAYTDNLDVKINSNEIQKYEESDEKYIKAVTNTTNEDSLSAYRTSLDKLRVDYDGDGTNEVLYTITNFSYQVEDYPMNSYMFMVDNSKVKIIGKSEGLKPFTIIDSLDLDNDGNFEVIVANEVVDVPRFDTCYQIYGMKNNNFDLVQKCSTFE